MIRIILDTTVFHQNSTLKGQDFRLLTTLSKAGALKLFLPYVVEKEFLTQQSASSREQIDSILRSVKTLSQRALQDELTTWLNAFETEVGNKTPAILDADEKNLNDWLQAINAEKMPICEAQAVGALDAYFHGLPPLKQAKIRKDIPDSFVFQALRKLALDNLGVVFVSGDSQLREAAKKLDNVEVYESLKAFIQTPDIQNLILQEEERQKIEGIKQRITTSEEISELLSNSIKDKLGEKVVWKNVGYDAYDIDSSDATISSYGEVQETNFLWNDLSYYGDGSFSLPFTSTMEVSITFYISKSDWYCLSDDEAPPVSDHNDHYFEAESEIEIIVEGILSFSVGDDISPDDEDLIIADTVEIDSIESIESN
ncbi:PIN domain-containing protein [Prosthecobacter dejongeii]|uniref:Phage-related protein n=1 Tax=Prosthecobacter dejongeii TaxID=48465 RepID=A0A7W7YML6_9BACT|nr:PIN domain-containing protein [Prosthecobacter dejongeii]MBB5038980.1 phage-related protein [Prosthecobacter dejongeii]